MIPKKIHYVWIGGNPFPELVQRCVNSWHQYMPEPEWQYFEWNEQTIADYCAANNIPSPLSSNRYTFEAYQARKFAFVSDYIRLWALELEGGLYMDVDFEVYKSFEPLLDLNGTPTELVSHGESGDLEQPNSSVGNGPHAKVSNVTAFIGREGSKHQPPMLGVMAAEARSPWITAMKHMYDNRVFIKPDGSFDMTTNVSFFAASGVHKPEWVHIYPVDYFCPVLTTGEDVRSENTYCEHKGLHSWSGNGGIKAKILNLFSPKFRTRLIKLKRKIVG